MGDRVVYGDTWEAILPGKARQKKAPGIARSRKEEENELKSNSALRFL